MTNMQYDLEERTKLFSKEIIGLLLKIRLNIHNENIIRQLSRSATSVGANYREANGASSTKDFKNKIYICRKEIQETKYWIELLAQTNKEIIEQLRKIWQEAQELTLIFNKITYTIKNKEAKTTEQDIINPFPPEAEPLKIEN